MRTHILPVIALALALSSSGCIANMDDLKDKLGASEGEAVAPAAVVAPTPDAAPTPEPVVKKAPVARITVFGTNGALVFKSSFAAEDPATMIMVEEKAKLNLIASDSEALETGASITAFSWSLAGKALEGGRQASAELPTAGVYLLILKVTDSNGMTDTQAVKLGVAPSPIDVVTEITTGPVVGANGEGAPSSDVFPLKADGAGVPATIQTMRVVATAPASCDSILEVTDPAAEVIVKDDTGNGGEESAEYPSAAEGDYVIRVLPFACAAPNGVQVTITVTYLPTVEGFTSEDVPHQH